MLDLIYGVDGVWRAWTLMNKLKLTDPEEYAKLPFEARSKEWVCVGTDRSRRKCLEHAKSY